MGTSFKIKCIVFFKESVSKTRELRGVMQLGSKDYIRKSFFKTYIVECWLGLSRCEYIRNHCYNNKINVFFFNNKLWEKICNEIMYFLEFLLNA